MLSTVLSFLPLILSSILGFSLLSNLTGIGVFVIVLCAMVVIHEFGHYIVAKVLGIPAEVFSVGFGKRLFGVNVGGTDFRLSAIPLGGYVRFRGEGLETLQGKSEGSAEEFLAHPKWKRLLVAFAGPAFNIATAILIPAVAVMIGFETSAQSSQPITIGRVVPNSPAEQAGLKPYDKVVVANGMQNPVWDDFKLDITLRPGERIPLTVERGGERVNLTVEPRPSGQDKAGMIGVEPYLPELGLKVKPDSPAARAGLQTGDRLKTINGQPLLSATNVQEVLKQNGGNEVTLGVERAGVPQSFKVTPSGASQDEASLGVVFQLPTVTMRKTNVGEALAFAVGYNWRFLKMNGVVFKQIFTGQRSARDSVAGPIGMAKITSDTFQAAGWDGTLALMGMLSLSLGIMNLLPIPVLDGGMILLIIVEGILGLFGMALTMNIRERFQQVGFVALMLLMGFVIFNDVTRLFTRAAPEPPAQQQQAQPQK
jgi:regulator of sigma E protease